MERQRPRVSKESQFVQRKRACLRNYAQKKNYTATERKSSCGPRQLPVCSSIPSCNSFMWEPYILKINLFFNWNEFKWVSVPYNHWVCLKKLPPLGWQLSHDIFLSHPSWNNSCLAMLPCCDLPASLFSLPSSHCTPPRGLTLTLSPGVDCALLSEETAEALVELSSTALIGIKAVRLELFFFDQTPIFVFILIIWPTRSSWIDSTLTNDFLKVQF